MYDAGVVFPQFLHYMEAYLDKPVTDHKLYTAHTASASTSGRTTSSWT